MKKLLTTSALVMGLANGAMADGHGVSLGIFLGFTGPIESLVANMGPAAEAAIAEVNASGNFMGGTNITSVRADTTCVDAAAATAAVTRCT